jgi:hypothetical protein
MWVAFIWLLAAILGSISIAYSAEINRRFKQDGFRLNLLRTGMAAILWLPVAAISSWQHSWYFYAAAIFGGFAMAIGSTIQNNLAAKHNGRVAILYMPLKALLVFVSWLVIDQAARNHMFDNPLRLPLVLGLFAIMVLAVNAMRRNDASWKALVAVSPIIILYGAADVLTRQVLPAAELAQNMIMYMFIVYASSWGFSMAYWPWRKNPGQPFYNSKLFHAAVEAVVGSAINYICFLIALVKAPNPAYVSMIFLLAPVWLLVYHKVTGKRDDANPYAGMVLVVAAILLIAVTL